MQFYPDHVFDATTLDIAAVGSTLRASGRHVISLGWHRLEPAAEPAEEDHGPVPALNNGEAVHIRGASVRDKKTKPPARYTEGTLIRAMTNIASVIDDPDAKKVLKEQDGIGTEATRGDIIQTLKDRKFVEVRKKALHSTDTGRALIAAVAPELQNPVLTAGMERELSQVADGSMTLEAFMARMEQLVTALVGTAVAQGQAGNGKAPVGAVGQGICKGLSAMRQADAHA